MEKINYNKYLLFNDPIPYIANSMTQSYELTNSMIYKLKNLVQITEEEQKNIQLLEEDLQKQMLIFYPITMKDCLMFYNCIDCMTIDKNSIPDPKVISMSYLDYLFYASQQDNDNRMYIVKLIEILKLSLHLEDKDINFAYDEKNHMKIIINNILCDKDDFEIFKEIICKQNGIELPDDDIHPDIKKALQEAQNYLNKRNGHPATVEDQIDCVMVGIHEVDRQKIKTMPIRNFQRFYQRYSYKIQYTICKTAEMGGMVTFKKPIDDWTDNLDRSFEEKYANVMVDSDRFTRKVKMEDLKEQ